MIEWRSEKRLFNQLSSEQTIYCQILHTVWYISGKRLKEKIEVDHSCEWKVKVWIDYFLKTLSLFVLFLSVAGKSVDGRGKEVDLTCKQFFWWWSTIMTKEKKWYFKDKHTWKIQHTMTTSRSKGKERCTKFYEIVLKSGNEHFQLYTCFS